MTTIKTFLEKMRDPRDRKVFLALFGGKLIGVGLCFAVMAAVSLQIERSPCISAARWFSGPG